MPRSIPKICEYATKRKTIGLLEACLSGDKVQVVPSDKGMNQIEKQLLADSLT